MSDPIDNPFPIIDNSCSASGCNQPGALSLSVRGAGPWWCAIHFWNGGYDEAVPGGPSEEGREWIAALKKKYSDD